MPSYIFTNRPQLIQNSPYWSSSMICGCTIFRIKSSKLSMISNRLVSTFNLKLFSSCHTLKSSLKHHFLQLYSESIGDVHKPPLCGLENPWTGIHVLPFLLSLRVIIGERGKQVVPHHISIFYQFLHPFLLYGRKELGSPVYCPIFNIHLIAFFTKQIVKLV